MKMTAARGSTSGCLLQLHAVHPGILMSSRMMSELRLELTDGRRRILRCSHVISVLKNHCQRFPHHLSSSTIRIEVRLLIHSKPSLTHEVDFLPPSWDEGIAAGGKQEQTPFLACSVRTEAVPPNSVVSVWRQSACLSPTPTVCLADNVKMRDGEDFAEILQHFTSSA